MQSSSPLCPDEGLLDVDAILGQKSSRNVRLAAG